MVSQACYSRSGMEGRRLYPPFAAEPRLRMPISNPGLEFMTDPPDSEPPSRKRVAVAVRHTSPSTKALGTNDAFVFSACGAGSARFDVPAMRAMVSRALTAGRPG